MQISLEFDRLLITGYYSDDWRAGDTLQIQAMYSGKSRFPKSTHKKKKTRQKYQVWWSLWHNTVFKNRDFSTQG